MANKNSKIVGRINNTERMTARCKATIQEYASFCQEEIKVKVQMLSDLADNAARILSTKGNANLELTEDEGLLSFFYTPFVNMIEDESQIPILSGIGDGGWEYKVIVSVTSEEEDSISSEILLARLKGDKAEVLTEDGWEEAELEFSEE